MSKRKATDSPLTVEKALKKTKTKFPEENDDDEQMNTEIEHVEKVKEFYTKHLGDSVKKKGPIRTMCSDHLITMEAITKDFRGKVVVTLFCKPGYGKSFIINQLLSQFKFKSIPLPSSVQFGTGLTHSVIDVEYSPTYSLTVQYCTPQELHARNVEHDSNVTLEDCEIDNQSNYNINGTSEDGLYEFLATKAHEKIKEFDTDTNFKKTLVKKLILRIPSKFLEKSKIVLRDMPGYDEKQTTQSNNTDNISYKHLIRESMHDTCLLLCGLENNRNIVDDGIVKKVWNYGLHQPQQTYQPYIAFFANNPIIDEETYRGEIMKKSNFDTMKESYGKQLQFHFDCELDGVPFDLELESNEINTEEIEIENKYEYVKGLYDNFDMVCVPPLSNDEMKQHFVSSLQSIIENNRKKIISYNTSLLRDMAIVVLSNTTVKSVHKLPLAFIKELRSCVSRIEKSLRDIIDGLKRSAPDKDSMTFTNVDSFIKKFSSYFTNPILLGFHKKEVKPELERTREKKLNQLKLQKKKDKWKECFRYFKNGFILKLESFISCFKTLTKRFQSKLSSILLQSTIPENFVKSLCYSLDPNVDEKDVSKEKVITDIIAAVKDFEEDYTNHFDETVNSWKELSFGLHKNVKELLQKYKNKKSSSGEIVIEEKFPFPQRLEECVLVLPDKDSEEVAELRPVPEKKKSKKQQKQKSFCSHNDALLKFKIVKRERSEIKVKVVDNKHTFSNEIFVKFNRDDEILEISYDETSFAAKLEKISTLTGDGLKPLFIKTRPRGKYWKPNLYSNLVTKLSSESIPNCVTIVTESKYINRYKKWIVANGNQVDQYNFIILESNMALGPGIVHSSILTIGQFLKLECIHIIQDDICEFYEYSRPQKLFVPHSSSMLRSLQFMEKVLHTELFNPSFSETRLVKLREILLGKQFTQDVLATLKSKYKLDEHIIEDLEEQFHVLDILDEYIKSIKGAARKKFNRRITAITNPESSEATLKLIVNNPQQFIELLKEIEFKDPTIKIATFIVEQLELLFDNKKHIGRVALWNYQVNESFKSKIHDLKRPTHTISYLTSGVNTYFLPSMKGILPIISDDFWEEPDNEIRKSYLKTISTNPGKKNPTPTKKEAAERGWCELEICEKTQMLLNGVGGFQVFCFGYSYSNNPSLINYKPSRIKDNFDSDEEFEEIDEKEEEEDEEEETKEDENTEVMRDEDEEDDTDFEMSE